MLKSNSAALALRAFAITTAISATTLTAALADTPAALKPAGATPIDAKISPQAKVEQQKAAMPPDTTSVKQLNKDQDDNLNSKDQVKVEKDLHSKNEAKIESEKSKKAK